MHKTQQYDLRKKANDYVLKERYDKALSVYLSLLNEAPEDPSLLIKVGDVYHVQGRQNDAVDMYFHAVQVYHSKEMYHQGIAVCRLILDADPLHIPTQQHLEEMYLKLYGGLPHSSGDTIMPSAPAMQVREDTLVEIETLQDDSRLDPAYQKDSWQPVDIVFSNADGETDDDASKQRRIGISAVQEETEWEVEVPEEEESLIPSIPNIPYIPLFDSLSAMDLKHIINGQPTIHVAKNEFILKEGERGDSFYIILKGSVHVLKGDMMRSVAWLGEGSCFGEMALLGAGLRRSSVLAVESTTLLEMKSVELELVLNRFPKVKKEFYHCVHERLFENMMSSSELFCHFPQEQHQHIKSHFQKQTYNRRETIIRRGETVKHLYFIVEGRVDILFDLPNHRHRLIRSIGIGESFGEIPLLTNTASKVTFRAGEPLVVLCLPKNQFKELMGHHPKILDLVSALLKTADEMAMSTK